MPANSRTTRLFTSLLAASLAALALLCAGNATAAIPAGNTGWSWSNPQPQGNTIDRLEVSGGRVWAGGATGTLLHSEDAGKTWVAVRTGLLDDIRTIEAISPNSVVFAGRCALRRTDDGGETVRRLAWGSSDDTCAAQIQSVSFPTPLIGYLLLTNGDVYVTGDGGDSWKKQSVAPNVATTGEAVRDISFTSANTGVLSVGTHIFQSVDAGVNWAPVKTAAGGAGLFNFEFIDANVGYAIGDHSELLKTIDGGTTWNAVVGDGTTSSMDIRTLDCASETTCLATSASSGYVLRTSDGGVSWKAVSVGNDPIYGASFVSATRAVAAGLNGESAVSEDAGASWMPVNSVATGKFHGLRVDSETSALIFGEAGAYARSIDGGQTWKTSTLPTSGTIVDAATIGAKRAYALDDAGKLYSTSDDGGIWNSVNIGANVKPRGLFAWKPTRLLLVGPVGVRVSASGGAKSKPALGAIAKLPLKSADAAGGPVFVYGARAIAVTKNHGVSWSIVRRPAKSGTIVRLDMVDAKYGFLLDSKAELFATRNGGRSWSRVETTGANLAVSMAFGDRTHGYLTDNTGRVLATADGGATWSRQYPFYDGNATSFSMVAAPSKLSALTLVQGTNHVFGTETGGRIGTPSLLTIKPSASRVRSGSIVRVTGKLSPATGIERVTVLARVINAKGGTRWKAAERTVSANGTFSTAWTITEPTEFIARWSGDASHDGDAAPLATVTLRK